MILISQVPSKTCSDLYIHPRNFANERSKSRFFCTACCPAATIPTGVGRGGPHGRAKQSKSFDRSCSDADACPSPQSFAASSTPPSRSLLRKRSNGVRAAKRFMDHLI